MIRPFIVISCEHGGNIVPAPYTSLFIGQEEVLDSHRGSDLGALQVAEILASALRAPLFFTTTSRLLIDTNRSPSHKDLFSNFSRTLHPMERERVIQKHYLPHRELVNTVIGTALEQREQVIHLAIHSFTPVLGNTIRKTDLGLLYDSRRPKEQEVCHRWQHALTARRPDLCIHRNAPYRGASDGLATTLRKHHTQNNYLGIEVEINQKLLSSVSEQHEIATLLWHTLLSCLNIPQPKPSTASRDEIVAIVDEENQVTGQAPRSEMRRHRLIHRACYILVTNHYGEIFVQKRTPTKDIYPGYFDIAAGGVVLAGETYEESAQRELAEELGINGDMEHLIDTYFADEGNKVWGRVFRCRHEGPFILQETEVESGKFMTTKAIMAETGGKFTPDGLAILATLKCEKLKE
ncbi:MAG: NUDIX hydrolase YfcD [Proteobacteria bacterium]|nr:NUDIX hydrolase YfcD [Desulfobulbaceae bacterium]MBU4151263.1 NUDIX hydrolase YfcD [Pseudomonadota bacterium]